jgi:hypothetical protein
MSVTLEANAAAGYSSPPQSQRYRDDGRSLYSFLFEGCDVLCPACSARGRVDYRQGDPSWCWSARFRCGRCAFAADTACMWYACNKLHAEKKWYGPIVARGTRACGRCGHKWVEATGFYSSIPAQMPAMLEAKCGRCQHAQLVSVQWSAYADIRLGIEPMFGMSLAWREPCRKGREIWVFSSEHLVELKRYVLANLRERGCHGNRSYFMRLPAWIKSAKHRGDVLAAIARIEKRMLSATG